MFWGGGYFEQESEQEIQSREVGGTSKWGPMSWVMDDFKCVEKGELSGGKEEKRELEKIF